MMHTFLITLASLLPAAAPCTCPAQSPFGENGAYHCAAAANTEKFYVVVEKTGLQVMCVMYGTPEEVQEHAAAVANRNKEHTAANKAIDEEVRKLKADLTAKERDATKAEDAEKKAQLEKEIEALKAQIAEKEASKKLITAFLPPRQFSTRQQAEKYIESVYDAADKEREKAEAKSTLWFLG